MYLETEQLLQLSGALLAAIAIFVAAHAAPLRVSVGILLVLIPFQPVDTKFGSANVVLTYVLAGALLIRGRLQYVPILAAMLAVIFSYLISMSQLPKSVYVLHGVEIIALFSGFLVFILAYNLAREATNRKLIINLLIAANVLSVIYCAIQLGVGPGERVELFGLRELRMNANRGGGDARLVGPFGTPGLTAAYLASMVLMLIYEVVYSEGWRKYSLVALALLNVAMIFATANRGSFMVLLVSVIALLYIFRAQFGVGRVLQILVGSTVLLVGISTTIIAYTDFGQMFDRLAETSETVDGIPATRARVWRIAWENIKQKPLIGHGPRILSPTELDTVRAPPEQLVGPEPHNLYLHMLVTVGVLGTACMLFFLFGVAWRVYQGVKKGHFSDAYERGWVIVGIIVIVAFFVDELKIEFLRHTTVDYAHYIFALFGIFLGWADCARTAARATDVVSNTERIASSDVVEIRSDARKSGPTAI